MRRANCILVLACSIGVSAQSQPDIKPDVAGVTLDSKGTPLRKVDLILLPQAKNALGEPIPSYTLVSDRGGKFEFYGIPPGRYRLMADHAGYLRTRYGAKTQWGAGTSITLKPGVPITGLEIRMPEQAVISGKVLADDSTDSVYVTLLQEAYQGGVRRISTANSAMAEPSGEFVFNRLAPGRYYLLARPMTTGDDPGSGAEVSVPTYYPGTSDQTAAQPIDLRFGQTVSVDLTVRKSPTFRVTGSVSGLPTASVRAQLTMRPVAENALSFAAMVTGPEGKFEFSRVPPGAYVLGGTVPDATAPRIVQQPIDVRGDVIGIVLKPEQHPALRGKLKVEGEGRAIPRLRVVLTTLSSPAFGNATVQSAADGSFTFPFALPGRYRLELPDLPPGAYLKSVKLGDKDAFPIVDFTGGVPEAQLELAISFAGGRIDGVILDEYGKPAEGTAALIPDPVQPEQPALYQTAEAGEGGQFQFQGIRPGKYRLYAWEEVEPGAHMDPKVTAPHEADSVAIEVSENDTKKATVKRIAVETTAPTHNAGK